MFNAHEINEIQHYMREIAEVERAPMHERKEACAEFLDVMANHPDLVGERIGWLLGGSYGQGAYLKARQVMEQSKRANKAASLTHMVAGVEWRCPARMAIASWKKLTAEQKKQLDNAVHAAMRYYESNKG